MYSRPSLKIHVQWDLQSSYSRNDKKIAIAAFRQNIYLPEFFFYNADTKLFIFLKKMFFRRFFWLSVLFLLFGCNSTSPSGGRLSIGVVSYGDSESSIEELAEFKTYLSAELKTLIELEPTYNERKAIEEIERQNWDVVFAPPGLAAIAISQSKYIPLFPLESGLKTRSVMVVLKNNPISQLSQLSGKIIALGQVGSASSYYLPIYNLYGLTLAQVRFAATPKTVLEWVSQGKVAAGAMSLADFNRYRADFSGVQFRILHTDVHDIPGGAVMVSRLLDIQRQKQIEQALQKAPSSVAASAGYVTNASPPDYSYLIEVVERVRPIAERIKQKPAVLH